MRNSKFFKIVIYLVLASMLLSTIVAGAGMLFY
ncbi:stressosome-associated protein Prli42 [Paenibacillus cisolokensis]|jgi:hypothetical protein|nr:MULTISPECIES: stressosome-associated protein Prli42 [Paenibacillus]ALS28382.1 hypothetical protein IJ21_29860 [Paenibacillus sp. 32O-W]